VNAAEVETHALDLRGERRGLAALGADLDHAEVEVVNAAEVETHALDLRGERRGLAALGADLDHTEVEVVNAAEVETHALGLRGEWRGLAALGADLDHAEVAVEVVNAERLVPQSAGLDRPTAATDDARKSQKRLLLSTVGRLPAEIKF